VEDDPWHIPQVLLAKDDSKKTILKFVMLVSLPHAEFLAILELVALS
jgi:hypothetical protein